MRREVAPSAATPDKFMGVRLSEYTPGKKVVVKDGKGKWVEGKLESLSRTAPLGAVVENGKLKIKLDWEPTTRLVEEPPEFFVFEPTPGSATRGDAVTDAKMGGDFVMTNGTVTKRGTIEYDVTNPLTREKVTGVAQELLVGWQDVVKLETDLNALEATILRLSGDKKVELTKKVSEARRLLDSLSNALPEDLAAMASQSGRAVAEMETKFSALHKNADDTIKRLAVQRDAALLTPGTVAPTAAAAKYHMKTGAEKADDKKTFETQQQKRKEFIVPVLEEIQQEIDEQTKQAVEAKILIDGAAATKKSKDWQDALDKMELDLASLQAATPPVDKDIAKKTAEITKHSAGKPPVFDPDKVQLKVSEIAVIKQKAENDIIESVLTKGSIPSGLQTEIEKGRQALAKRKFTIDKSKVRDIATTPPPVYEFVDPKDEDAANKAVLKKILTEAEKVYEEKPEAVPTGEVEFNFDASTDALMATAKAVLDSMPKEDDGSPKANFGKIYIEIMEIINKAGTGLIDQSKNLATLDKARTATGMPTMTEAMLKTAREKLITDTEAELRIKIEKVESMMGVPSGGAEHEHGELGPIDFNESLLMEMFGRLPADVVATAMKEMYRGRGADAFKNVFGTTKPAGIRDIDARLREAGIKDWSVFKKLWDTSLAAEAAKTMEEAAKQTLMRKVAEYMDSMSGKWDQIKTVKGQLLTRAGVNAVLIGGMQLGIAKYVGLASDMLAAAQLAGGAASGAIKYGVNYGITNTKVGGVSWNESNQNQLAALRVQKEKDLIDSMVDEGLIAPGAPAPKRGLLERIPFIGRLVTPAAEKQERKGILDGAAMFARAVAQTVREKTAKAITVGDLSLSGNARLRYERALAGLETKNLNEEQQRQLASVFLQMTREGETQMAATVANNQSQSPNSLDKIIGYYSGRGSLGGSIATNTVVSGLYLVSGTARAIFGGFMGAVQGWKAGDALRISREKEGAKRTVTERIKLVRRETQAIEIGGLPADKQKFKDEVINLKRFLHGTASPEELSAAIDFGTDKDGNAVQRVDELLLHQIESVVYDAEKTDILLDKEEDKMKLEKVLAAMTAANNKSQEKVPDTIGDSLKKWSKKQGYRVVGAAAGGAIGAGAFFAGGWLAGKAMNRIRNFFGWTQPEIIAAAGAAGAAKVAADHASSGAGGARPADLHPGATATPEVRSYTLTGDPTEVLLKQAAHDLHGHYEAGGLDTVEAQQLSNVAANLRLLGDGQSVKGLVLPKDLQDVGSIFKIHGNSVRILDADKFGKLEEYMMQRAEGTHSKIGQGAWEVGRRNWNKVLPTDSEGHRIIPDVKHMADPTPHPAEAPKVVASAADQITAEQQRLLDSSIAIIEARKLDVARLDAEYNAKEALIKAKYQAGGDSVDRVRTEVDRLLAESKRKTDALGIDRLPRPTTRADFDRYAPQLGKISREFDEGLAAIRTRAPSGDAAAEIAKLRQEHFAALEKIDEEADEILTKAKAAGTGSTTDGSSRVTGGGGGGARPDVVSVVDVRTGQVQAFMNWSHTEDDVRDHIIRGLPEARVEEYARQFIAAHPKDNLGSEAMREQFVDDLDRESVIYAQTHGGGKAVVDHAHTGAKHAPPEERPAEADKPVAGKPKLRSIKGGKVDTKGAHVESSRAARGAAATRVDAASSQDTTMISPPEIVRGVTPGHPDLQKTSTGYELRFWDKDAAQPQTVEVSESAAKLQLVKVIDVDKSGNPFEAAPKLKVTYGGRAYDAEPTLRDVGGEKVPVIILKKPGGDLILRPGPKGVLEEVGAPKEPPLVASASR